MYDPLNVYRGRYKEFIESIKKERPLNERLEYSHDHHIVPKCTFEDNNDPRIDDEDNHIYLTYREHFLAHQILWKENPDNEKLFYAYWRMCNGRVTTATPEEYYAALREFSISNPGKHHSEKARSKMSDSHRGVPLSEDHRISISNSLKGYTKSEEHRKHLSDSHLGKKLSIETRKKLSDSHLGHIVSQETKKKISDSTSGKLNPFYGKRHTPDSLKKMSESKRGENHPMHGKHYSTRFYRKVCIRCNTEFLGNSPTSKICMNCRLLS